MSDFEKLINASDLIEWIMETYPDWCVGAIRGIVDHINEQPSAQPERQWIPCSERLPEVDGCYLAQIGSVPSNIFVARWHVYGGGWWNVKTPVTAWMPLPEPYKEEK